MSGLIESAGAVKNPSKYGGVGMGGRQFTGVVTQRSPYRDGAVPFLVGKFYGGSRIDTIIDGANREITQALTDKRAPGSSVYNSNTFPAAQSMDVWKYIQNNVEVVKVLYDGLEGVTPESITGFEYDTDSGKQFITIFFTGSDVIAAGTPVTFAGLTVAVFLNGTTKNVYSSSAGQATFYLGNGSLGSGVVADTGTATFTAPDTVYDATAGQKSTLFTKAANAGPSRFLSVNTELFISDGVDQQKILAGSMNWQSSQAMNAGQLITTNGNPGYVQMGLGGMTMPVLGTASDGTHVYVYVDPQQVPLNFTNLQGATITLSGLTVKTGLNGAHTVVKIISTTLGIFTINVTNTAYAYTAEGATASSTTGNGTTGTTAPTFSTTEFTVVQDAGQQWKCYGPALQSWGLATPTAAPVIAPVAGVRFWAPNTALTAFYSIYDQNGNIEVTIGGGTTGRTYPNFPQFIGPDNIPVTSDGTPALWSNVGPIGKWLANTSFGSVLVGTGYSPSLVILDSNGNLQLFSSSTGPSGASQPTWATTIGATTTDQDITWTCLGPGTIISTATLTFGYSTHAIDGSVSTSSSTTQIQGAILGSAPVSQGIPAQCLWTLTGAVPNDPQIDQVWLWRTAQGVSTLILEDQIASDGLLGAGFTYNDPGIPDTSTNGGGSLDAEISAPVAEQGDPPQSNMTAPVYHLQRVWAIVGNTVVYSGGPDTVTGNGLTAFPPLNEIPFPAQPIRLDAVTVQNGGLIVRTTDGVYIILGTGTSSNPFYTTSYYPSVSVSSYTACGQYNNALFQLESNGKVSTLAIEYPFNPQTGYTEVGFPIGDQFPNTNFGGVTATFNPASSFLSWCLASSADSGMYVADGAGHWWRMSLINPPESGILWNPLRTIVGGSSAVQSVEVSPGTYRLLIAPPSSGPILMRDTTGTVWNDNGTAYGSWDAKGINLLCQTGQWADVAWISAKSRLLGARPTVSVLLNEITALPAANGAPYSVLTDYTPDPSRGRKSKSVFSDRYELQQNGVETECDCLLVKFDYGTQQVADELLDWQIYASVHDEREEAVSK